MASSPAISGYIRRRLGKSLAEKHATAWEQLKRAIFGTSIFMFAVLAAYCFYVIDQETFGAVYAIMSLLNIICLWRSYSINRYDEKGVPMRHHRQPKRVTPVIEVPSSGKAVS